MEVIFYLGKIVLILMVAYIIIYRKKFIHNLNSMSLKPVLICQGIVLLGTMVAIDIFVIGMDDTFGLVILLTVSIVTSFYFVYIINRIEDLYKDKIIYEKKLQQEVFNTEKLTTIKKIKNEIDAIDHRLFYVILEIENLIRKEDYEKAQKLIEKYKTTILKHKMIINTNNGVFDCLLSLKINDLLLKDVDVKTCIFISVNEFYDYLPFIDFLTTLLNYYTKASYLDFDIREINQFIKIRFIFDSTNLEVNQIVNSIKENKKNLGIDYVINQLDQHQHEIRIILPFE